MGAVVSWLWPGAASEGRVPGNEYRPLLDEEVPPQTRCQRCLQCIRWFLWFICIIPVKEYTIQVRTTGNTGGCEEQLVQDVSERLFWKVVSLKVKRIVEDSRSLILLFCPIASRSGTDIQNALEGLTSEDKAILVVMHFVQTDNTDTFIDTRQQRHPALLRTVHTCYSLLEGFYPCKMNEVALASVANAIKEDLIKQDQGCCSVCCC